MENPHHEDDAQYWHVVTADEFDREEYDAESTAPLRSASRISCLHRLLQMFGRPQRPPPWTFFVFSAVLSLAGSIFINLPRCGRPLSCIT